MAENVKKPDCILSDGRQIFIDLHKITRNEWRGIFSTREDEEQSDASISKCTGIPAEELGSLPLDDWRRITAALVKKFQEPLSDPT